MDLIGHRGRAPRAAPGRPRTPSRQDPARGRAGVASARSGRAARGRVEGTPSHSATEPLFRLLAVHLLPDGRRRGRARCPAPSFRVRVLRVPGLAVADAVVPAPAVAGVEALRPVDPVVADPTDDDVVAALRREQVVSIAAVDDVTAGSADDDVVAVPGVDDGVAGAGVDGVRAVAGLDPVVLPPSSRPPPPGRPTTGPGAMPGPVVPCPASVGR